MTSFTYEIPNFRHIRGLGFLPDRFSNGWRLTGIDTLQTGLPVVIKDSGFTSLTCDALSFYGCWDLPNQVAPVQALNPRTAPNNDYFNPSDFAVATLGTIGDAGRNPFHGPGLNNLDIVFAKTRESRNPPGWSYDLKPTTSSITLSSSTRLAISMQATSDRLCRLMIHA